MRNCESDCPKQQGGPWELIKDGAGGANGRRRSGTLGQGDPFSPPRVRNAVLASASVGRQAPSAPAHLAPVAPSSAPAVPSTSPTAAPRIVLAALSWPSTPPNTSAHLRGAEPVLRCQHLESPYEPFASRCRARFLVECDRLLAGARPAAHCCRERLPALASALRTWLATVPHCASSLRLISAPENCDPQKGD